MLECSARWLESHSKRRYSSTSCHLVFELCHGSGDCMARRLDFLVPHWQETPELMTPLLDSIKIQCAVDLSQVGVIIAFDGPDATELPLDEWRETYPFAIDDIHPPKGGVSATRNAALDASNAEYVIFADADDSLMDIRGLFIVFREMDAMPNPSEMVSMGVPKEKWEKGFDFLIADFIEETRDESGNVEFVPHVQNMTFVHSQTFRRQWLLDNDIRFRPDVQCHEDSFVICLARETVLPWRGKICQHPWYLWRFNPDSTCRCDPEFYIRRTFNSMISSNDALVDEFVRRMMPEKANAYAVMMFWESYFTLMKREWVEQSSQEYRIATEKRFARYARKHMDKWNAVPETEKLMISQGVRQRSIQEGMLMESTTITKWLEDLLGRYSEEDCKDVPDIYPVAT